jgi:hypothetical protein
MEDNTYEPGYLIEPHIKNLKVIINFKPFKLNLIEVWGLSKPA